MMKPIYLALIILASAWSGYLISALCVTAGRADEHSERMAMQDNDEVFYDDEHQYSGLLTDDED